MLFAKNVTKQAALLPVVIPCGYNAPRAAPVKTQPGKAIAIVADTAFRTRHL